MKTRIAFVNEEPDTYRIPFFDRINRKDNLEFRVFYCRRECLYRGGRLELGKSREFSEILPGRIVKIPFLKTRNYFNPIIWNKLSSGRFDCIIAGGYYHLTMLIAILWARVHKVPYMIISESHLLNERGKWKSLIKRILLNSIIRKAAAYLPVGKYAGEYLIHFGAEPDRIFYFPNTPDVEFFIKESDRYIKEKAKIKKNFGIDKNFVILFVGRLVKEKGLFTLLRAFKEVKSVYSNVSLLLVGDGVLRESLQNFIEKERIEDVHFAGLVPNEELPRYYRISDIFVLPSIYEPWGVVVNEAMASGLPVILSDKVGSGRDLLREGENGLTYPSGDYEKLAICIEHMLSRGDELKRMGELSREIIRNFDYSYCEENLKRAILKIRE